MDIRSWIPGCIRSRAPEELFFRFHAPGCSSPHDLDMALSQIVSVLPAVTAWTPRAGGGSIELEATTWVYGLVRRDLSERIDLEVVQGPRGAVLAVRCRPQEHHRAHAVGIAGACALAGVTLFVGVAPGLTALLAGTLWTVYIRELSMGRYSDLLKRLTAEVGDALWPGAMSEVEGPIEADLSSFNGG